MTDENRAAGQGEEGAGGLVLPKAVHGPNWAVSTEDDSASPSPQRAFGPIREAIACAARDEHFWEAAKSNEMYSWKELPDHHRAHWLAFADRVLALLGEAPPKAEQDNVTYELPPGATVQPQARPMTWTMDVPKVPGPYWCRGNYGPTPGEKFVVRIQAHPDGAITMSDCRGRTNVIHERDRNREFAGPIPEPIEPPHQGEAT